MLGLLLVPIAYLIGSIPFGLVVAKFAGLGDIRKQGSGNIGATNVARIGGKKWGILTFILDAGKGVIPVLVARRFFDIDIAAVCAVAAVIGHIFPVWLHYQGGKGVATTIAVLFALDATLGVFFAAVWVGIFIIHRISSFSAISALLATPFFALVFCDKSIFFANLILSAIVIYRHKDNIKRLRAGTEKSFRKGK